MCHTFSRWKLAFSLDWNDLRLLLEGLPKVGERLSLGTAAQESLVLAQRSLNYSKVWVFHT